MLHRVEVRPLDVSMRPYPRIDVASTFQGSVHDAGSTAAVMLFSSEWPSAGFASCAFAKRPNHKGRCNRLDSYVAMNNQKSHRSSIDR